ncbi:hypothetical protein Tco_0557248 [Tanacetum coccineum]
MGMYINSQSSCDFTTVTIIGKSKERRTTEGIIQNYYDREDGKATPRFELPCWGVIMEYLVKLSKRHAFRSLNDDILKIYDSDYQYAVSIKKDTTYPCLHSPKTTKETSLIRHIQKKVIRRIKDIVCEDSGRYQAWSLLHETPNTSYPIPLRRIKTDSRQYK